MSEARETEPAKNLLILVSACAGLFYMAGQTLDGLGLPVVPGPLLYLVAVVALAAIVRNSVSRLCAGGWKLWGFILLGLFASFAFDVLWFQVTNSVGAATNSNTESIRGQLLDHPFAMGFAVVVIGPVVEEMLYRFGIFRLLSGIYVPVGHLGTALCFAFQHVGVGWLVHGDPSQLWHAPGFVVYSLVMTMLYRRTGTILAPILVHMASNAIGVGFMLA